VDGASINLRPLGLPPFSQVIKSRDVEDPVNIWVHRPLAYAFVAATYRTALTPNQITLLAMLVGIAAGICWAIGTPTLMIWGGALLWTSAILDGADGIMARAKQMHSELGRALDGLSDVLVAVVTVLPGFYHVATTTSIGMNILWIGPVAFATTWLQVYLYDFYKESYMSSLNPAWDGTSRALAFARTRVAQADANNTTRFQLFIWKSYVGMLSAQIRVISWTNSLGLRHEHRFPVSPELALVYRKHNYWPLQIWALVSLCPHSYLMAICGMADRLDVYVWFRLVGANVLFVIVLLWQRIATRRTLEELASKGLAPTLYDGPMSPAH
jgi:phosphatidylglycerophosphate synthase